MIPESHIGRRVHVCGLTPTFDQRTSVFGLMIGVFGVKVKSTTDTGNGAPPRPPESSVAGASGGPVWQSRGPHPCPHAAAAALIAPPIVPVPVGQADTVGASRSTEPH